MPVIIDEIGTIYWKKNTVKAAILNELNKPLIVDDIKLPGSLAIGQVLVKIECSTICGAQIGEITGAKGEDKYLPHLLGHEGCGRVIEIGQGVTNVKVADRVVMHWRKGNGINAPFPKYEWRNGEVGGGNVTTFCQYAVISENRLTPIGEDIPGEVASLMGCAVTTALGLINNEAKLKIGQSIIVIGCGGVGLNIIQGAKMVSANPIIAIDKVAKKVEIAREFGATDGYSFSDGMVFEWLDIDKADVVVDCTGSSRMIDLGYKLTKPGGKLILVGQPGYDQSLIIRNIQQHYCGKTIMDSQGGLTNPSEDIPRYLDLYRAGKLKLESLITHKFPLERINEAVEMAQSGEAIRVLIEMNNDEQARFN